MPFLGFAALALVVLQTWLLCSSLMLTQQLLCRLPAVDMARFTLRWSTLQQRSCCNCMVERRWRPLVVEALRQRHGGFCALTRRSSWQMQKHGWWLLAVLGYRLVHVFCCLLTGCHLLDFLGLAV